MLALLLELGRTRRLSVMGTAPVTAQVLGAHVLLVLEAKGDSPEGLQRQLARAAATVEKKAAKLKPTVVRHGDLQLEPDQEELLGTESMSLHLDDPASIGKLLRLLKDIVVARIKVKLEEGFPDDQYRQLYETAFQDAEAKAQVLAKAQGHRLIQVTGVEVWHTNKDELFKVILEYETEEGEPESKLDEGN